MGEQMAQDGENQTAQITRPTLQLLEHTGDSQSIVGTVNAETATIDHATSLITLNGPTEVELVDQTITTRDVQIDQLKQTATTAAAARIDRAGDWLTGEGLAVDFTTRQVQLHANVVAFFAARETKP